MKAFNLNSFVIADWELSPKMESIWMKGSPEPGIFVKNEIEFDPKSEPENDFTMESETEVQVKTEPEAVVWIKSEPEVDPEIKMELEADQETELEFDVRTKVDYFEVRIIIASTCMVLNNSNLLRVFLIFII